ncbi:hypothetical protein [Nakamurella leprariae]|uniref:Trypsin-like serine protease n=1 Tax=Nakamurella leprariae TaxID=2803911 RepID=A0A938YBT7_9ACTN|nr:hypothetical protein [Nakamurella leprariae]MBM9469636.1 hypothetical protein [Nakamurella leprariae]
MKRRKTLHRWTTVVAGALTLLAAVPANAASKPVSTYDSTTARPIDRSNVDLVAELQPLEKCLYEFGVYPAGGVGYKDSSLPYDHYTPLQASVLTLRAQIMRNNVDTVAGILIDSDGQGVSSMQVAVSSRTTDSQPSIAELVVNDPIASAAYDYVKGAAISVGALRIDAAPLRQQCTIREEFHSLRGVDGRPVTVYTSPSPGSGKMNVVTTPHYEEPVRQLAKRFASDVAIAIDSIEDAGRHDDFAPWYGGLRVNDGMGNCSTSFRVNVSSVITADHCAGSGPYGLNFVNNGSNVGWASNSLKAANVDAKVLTGSTYDNKIWTGPVDNTTTFIKAEGIYPYALAPANGQFLISGAQTGQGALTYQGIYNNAGTACLSSSWGYGCQLLELNAVGTICHRGDSGGPVGQYDPINSRVVALGVVKAVLGDQFSSHKCLITNIEAISFLYGGATIG